MPKISVIPWIIKKLKGAIGIVEDTDTAVHAIASGKYVVWKGTLCKATAAIAIGDTLSAGTGGNLAVVDDGGLNDVNGNIPAVYNGLDSTSTTDALSAAQGKELNSKIETYQIGTGYTSLTTLESALKTYADLMINNEVKNIKFTINSAIGIFPSGVYIGTIKRHANGRYAVMVQRFSDAGTAFIGNYNSTWTWDSLAVNSKIDGFKYLNGLTSVQQVIDALPNTGDAAVVVASGTMSAEYGSSGVTYGIFTHATATRYDFIMAKQNGFIIIGNATISGSSYTLTIYNGTIGRGWTKIKDFTTDGGGDYATSITIPSSASEFGFNLGTNGWSPCQINYGTFKSASTGWNGPIAYGKYNIAINKNNDTTIVRVAVRQMDGSTVGDAANLAMSVWYR